MCLCVFALHAQVSVGLYLQQCVLPAPSRCVNGLTHRIMMRGRAAGHVDTVDLLMVLTLLCVLSCGSALFASNCATSWPQCNERESWQPGSGCSDATLKSWSPRGATDRYSRASSWNKALHIYTTAQNSKAQTDQIFTVYLSVAWREILATLLLTFIFLSIETIGYDNILLNNVALDI